MKRFRSTARRGAAQLAAALAPAATVGTGGRQRIDSLG